MSDKKTIKNRLTREIQFLHLANAQIQLLLRIKQNPRHWSASWKFSANVTDLNSIKVWRLYWSWACGMLNNISSCFSGFLEKYGTKISSSQLYGIYLCKRASRTTQNWEYKFIIRVSKILKIFIEQLICIIEHIIMSLQRGITY